MLFASQIRSGRAIVKMSQLELALKTELHISTIKRLENDDSAIEKADYQTLKKIRTALENRGVRFIFPKEDQDYQEGFGVKYFKSKDREEN